MTIIITVFVLLWIWCIWEALNTPLMPDDYSIDDRDVYDNLNGDDHV